MTTWRIAATLIAALALAGPAGAQEERKYCEGFCSCELLWVERNEYYFEADYCFRSKLGAAVFNPVREALDFPCTTDAPSFPADIQRRVDRIREMERAHNCAAERENWNPLDLRAIFAAG